MRPETELIVTPKDMQSAKICMKGVRADFREKGLDYQKFLNGKLTLAELASHYEGHPYLERIREAVHGRWG